MNIGDFNTSLTSKKLRENISKQFGMNLNLSKYNREQLEDMRNKLRTNMFQVENSAGINDLLHNESYQKNKAMLELLNLRIKEMLGEDIKKLKDKLQQLDEAKKGVRAPKHTKKAKGTNDGNLANNYPPYDKVTRGDVVAGALGQDQQGGKVKTKESTKMSCCCKTKGKENCPVHGPDKVDETKGTPFDPDYKPADTDSETITSSTGGTIKKTKTGLTHTAGKRYSGKSADEKVEETSKSPFDPDYKPADTDSGTRTSSTGGTIKQTKTGLVHKAGKHYAGGSDDRAETEKNAKNLEENKHLFRQHVRVVNETLAKFLAEDEEEKAKAITAASDIANDFTSWMQRVGQYQTKAMIELADEIRHEFGADKAEQFKQAVAPALAATLDTLMQQREVIGSAVANLAGGQPIVPMGAEPMAAPEAPMEPTGPDMMNQPEAGPDEFAASDAAAGAGATGRELRESASAKLATSHSIISKLAK